MAPPRDAHPRPASHAELIRDLSLSQEAYFRVRKAVEAGALLNSTFAAVAEELNALGYRNSNDRPLQASSIRRRYYAVLSQEGLSQDCSQDAIPEAAKDMDRRLRQEPPDAAA